MKSIFLLTAMLVSIFSHAQVKIGDNPGVINPNSLLELESSTKGLLAPRVALNDLNAASPLTAPVPSGMIVYSSGGSVTDGFYFWNGAKWLAVQSSANTRTNHVIVKSVADLPAPVGGVINLVAGTSYEINGTISLSSKINLNGCYLVGLDANNDKLVYTPSSGELFTGTKGGTIKTVTLVAAGTGAKLFNLDMGVAENLLVRDAIVAGCKDVGVVKGGNICFFSVVNFSGNSNGIIFQDIVTLLLDNTAWFSNNGGTFEKLAGTFTVIEKLGGFSHAMAATSGVALDITGITTINEAGNLKNTAFLGTGTRLNGTFSKKWEVEAAGINTEKDAVATGSLYISTSALTDITAVNTPKKVAGTTTSTELIRFSAPVSNRLQYDGTKTRTFSVMAAMSATGASGTNLYSFYVYKNGVQIPASRQRTKVYSASGDIQVITIVCTVTLAPGDYVEVWTENNDANVDLTMQNMTMTVK
ncbi:MAG TPA: hypothetical protein VFR58_07745 [Flavisolibacter sp.]|nr:hypothetical protein [Flavisolibacter sp.]